MAIEEVRDFLKSYGKDKYIREFDTSSATVELAAEALMLNLLELQSL
ncbi:MAG: hypothetical protein ACLTYB_11690 [Clostridium paraputrificum]